MKLQTFENATDYIVLRYSSEHRVQFEIQFVRIQFSEQLTAGLKTRLEIFMANFHAVIIEKV